MYYPYETFRQFTYISVFPDEDCLDTIKLGGPFLRKAISFMELLS